MTNFLSQSSSTFYHYIKKIYNINLAEVRQPALTNKFIKFLQEQIAQTINFHEPVILYLRNHYQ
jgi:hypothetical protein